MFVRFVQKVVSYPVFVISFLLIITLFFVYQSQIKLFDTRQKLIIDSTMEPFISRESGVYDFFLEMRKRFGNEEVMVVAIKPEHPDTFDLEMFLTLERLVEDIKLSLPEVDDVISVTNVPRIQEPCRGQSYFHIPAQAQACESVLTTYQNSLDCLSHLNSVEEDNPEDPFDSDLDTDCEGFENQTQDLIYRKWNQNIKHIWNELKGETLIQKDLISPDFNTIALIIIFNNGATPSHADIQTEFQQILDNYRKTDLRIAYSGSSRAEYLYSVNIKQDMARILPFSLLLMVMTLTLSFRSFRGVVIPLIVIITGIIWTFGLFAVTGHKINLVTMVLPPLLICIGCAYIIHFMNRYYMESAGSDMTRDIIINNTLKHITTPLAVTALTTIAGFAALTVSPIPAIRELGMFACFGIAVINILILILVPSILALLPPLKKGSQALKADIIDSLLNKMSVNIGKNSKRNIVFWIILGTFASVGTFMVTFDSKTSTFSSDTPIEQDLALIQENLAGTSTLRIILKGKSGKHQLQTARTIKGIDKIGNWLTQKYATNELSEISGIRIDKVYSAATYIEIWKDSRETLSDSDVREFFNESRRKNVPQYLSDDQELMLVTIRMKVQSTKALLQLRDLLDRKLLTTLPELHVRYTGNSILSSEAADNISKSQIQSILLALSIIFVILSILFMSVKMGFIALYPNIIAIAIFFGTLGWIEIPIGVTISVIASIALGIGVDDTIHFLSYFNENVKELRNEKEASLKTLRQTGKPMVYTTISLGLGFIIFYMADMESQVLFGLLTAYTLTVCLITDLNFLPSIMVQTRLITAWDYLGLKYSRKRVEKIDIFQNMTLRETKLTSLLAYTVDLSKDEILFREKEIGNELYVILEGEIRIYLEKKYHGKEKHLTQLYTGSTFGEMGLFRHTKRSAAASTISNTKLLVINKKVLIRIHKRYPAIAAKLFTNIARNLSEAIKRVDHQIREARNQIDRTPANKPYYMSHSIKEVVETIITDGYVTYEEERLLNQIIQKIKELSSQDKKYLDFLDYLISEKRVIKKTPPFLNIFQGMKHKDKKWLIKQFGITRIPDRVQAFSQEAYGDFIIIVLRGGFTIDRLHNQTQLKTVVISPGNIIGMIDFLTSSKTQHSRIYSNEDSEVIYISRSDLSRMGSDNKKLSARFYYNVVCMLSDRLEEANTQLFYESI